MESGAPALAVRLLGAVSFGGRELGWLWFLLGWAGGVFGVFRRPGDTSLCFCVLVCYRMHFEEPRFAIAAREALSRGSAKWPSCSFEKSIKHLKSRLRYCFAAAGPAWDV